MDPSFVAHCEGLGFYSEWVGKQTILSIEVA